MSQLFRSKESWPLEEVLSGRWNQKYKVDRNAPFSFKIADCSNITKSIRNEIKANQAYQQLYNEFLSFESRQSDTKLWIKFDNQIIDMTLLDVYQCFIKYLKDKSFEDQLFNVNEVSFIGPSGPYTEIPLIQCLNDRLIDQFVFNGVLNNKIPSRKFRVYTESKLLVEFGEAMDLTTVLDMKQITDTGILFSTKDALVIQEMSKSDLLKFFIDTRSLKKFINDDLSAADEKEDFFFSENQLRYFFIEERNVQKSLSYRSSEEDEFFLFCKFHHMLESDVPNIFMDFTEKLEDYFRFVANS